MSAHALQHELSLVRENMFQVQMTFWRALSGQNSLEVVYLIGMFKAS